MSSIRRRVYFPDCILYSHNLVGKRNWCMMQSISGGVCVVITLPSPTAHVTTIVWTNCCYDKWVNLSTQRYNYRTRTRHNCMQRLQKLYRQKLCSHNMCYSFDPILVAASYYRVVSQPRNNISSYNISVVSVALNTQILKLRRKLYTTFCSKSWVPEVVVTTIADSIVFQAFFFIHAPSHRSPYGQSQQYTVALCKFLRHCRPLAFG